MTGYEPITNPDLSSYLDGTKAFLRVDQNLDDPLIQQLIDAAVSEIVSYAHVQFGVATWAYSIPFTPSLILSYPQPVQSVTQVLVDGVEVHPGTLPTQYTYSNGILAFGADVQGEEVNIEYTAGYSDIPPDALGAIYQRVKFAYDYGDDLPYDKARFFDRLMFRYRTALTF